MQQAPRVFISYSHDSYAHQQSVLELSNRLRQEGVDCFIDRYVNGFPLEGWPRWMENQIELADFILVICTPTYLKRFKGHDLEAGRGVNYEGVTITQTLYNAFQKNRRFIPIIPDDGSRDHVPTILQSASIFKIKLDYEAIYRVLTNQPETIILPLGDIRKLDGHSADTLPNQIQLESLRSPEVHEMPNGIHIDRLPTVPGEFLGRQQELQLLEHALANLSPRVIQFIAAGGTGKTKLLRHWLNQHTDDIPNRIVWSFYSQGTSDSKQVSASPMFTEAFKVFSLNPDDYKTEEDKADAFAQQLIKHQCLLVLDGLEPLQYGGKGMDGRLKDRAMARLLKTLAQRHTSLCIVTTRIAVFDLSDQPKVRSHLLENLSTNDGIRLLRSLGVCGGAAYQTEHDQLKEAVEAYGNHALALHLLGNALHTYFDGNVLRRYNIDELIDDYDYHGRHAFKIMRAYEHWLTDDQGQPLAELQLLYLLGLFDHPIETEVLAVLWQARIPSLTTGIPKPAWQVAIRNLRDKHYLLSRHENRPELLDCHPLIREYFGGQLKQDRPQAWQQAHECLYHYYKDLPDKELPDTLEEMQPLFSAVAHGCTAGLHQQAVDDVFFSRIHRQTEFYSLYKLGAFSDDLAAIAHFFIHPWHQPVAGLEKADEGGVLNWAGFCLRALGRLREALEAMKAAGDFFKKQKNWKFAAVNTNTLSELQLSLGDLAQAVDSGQLSVDYADKYDNWRERRGNRTTLADALHQSGEPSVSLDLFRMAEQIQQENRSVYPRLYSLQGFRYCDLLLDLGETAVVKERAEQTLGWVTKAGWLLDIAIDQLTLGRAHLQQALNPSPASDEMDPHSLQQATYWLDLAVTGLHEAGQNQILPHGLLTRAALHRHKRDFTRAQQDLEEVCDIAEPSEMRLHLTDYHLEAARLGLAAASSDPAQLRNNFDFHHSERIRTHVDTAAELIKATGYKRRLPELEELRTALLLGLNL